MASTIQSQTIGGIGDQCIALAASQFGRAHGYGDNWNTLRVGLLFAVEDTGATINGIVFRAGFCNGTTNMPGDATTDNSFGIRSAANWTRAGTTPNFYHTIASPTAFTRVGATENISSTLATTRIAMVGVNRTALFLEAVKGNPNYTLNFFRRSGTAGTSDITPAMFLAQIASLSPTLSDHTYTTNVASLAVSAANGILDTVYVGWNLLTPRIFISNLAVVRLA